MTSSLAIKTDLSKTSTVGQTLNQETVPPSTILPTLVNITKVASLLKDLTPLSLPGFSHDLRIRLWKTSEHGMFASIQDQEGQLIRFVPQHKIRNFLLPHEDARLLAQRLEGRDLRRWNFIYDPKLNSLVVLPHLEAAGKDKGTIPQPIRVKGSPLLYSSEARVKSLLQAKGYVQKPGDPNAYINEKRGMQVHIDRHGEGNDPAARHHVDVRFLPGKLRELQQQKEAFRAKRIQEKKQDLEQRQASGKISERDARKEMHEFSKRMDKQIEGYESVKKKWRFAFGDDPPKGGRKDTLGNSPASKAFKQTLQQTKLTDSYNSTHRNNPVAPKGGTGGTIGGVACSMDYIEGLFDTPESLFENDHCFCLPQLPGGQIPFSNEELRQILRELAIGIYTHSTVPFFSLHFKQGTADLFPVIHPAYENTLVGRVIGMLDYIMKGYLNGGVFKEGFIDDWHKDPNWKSKESSALQELINFEAYCTLHLQGSDRGYKSTRALQEIITQHSLFGLPVPQELENAATGVSKVLSNFEGFKNSFRIIAKQGSYRKEGNLFVLDSDFDVFYTVEPSPEYKEELAKYMRTHEGTPPSYDQLQATYEVMKTMIHNHMVKFPLCQKYFAMLGVINFFSSYFSTLKKHRRIPDFESIERAVDKGCPPLFPHLPITTVSKEVLRFHVRQVMELFLRENRPTLENYFSRLFDHLMRLNQIKNESGNFDLQAKNIFLNKITTALENNLISNCSIPLQRLLRANPEYLLSIRPGLQKTSIQLFDALLKTYEDYLINYKQIPKPAMIEFFLSTISYEVELVEFIKLPTQTFFSIPPDLSPEVIERNKRVVGGCGMALLEKGIQPSRTAQHTLRNNWETLSKLEPESWATVDIGEGVKGSVFRLFLEEVPSWHIDDYSWMESTLILPRGVKDLELIIKRADIISAMSTGNHEEFNRLVHDTKDLDKLVDGNQATLLHSAARNKDPFYAKTLIKKGCSCGARDIYGYIPTHYAAMEGCVETLKLFYFDRKYVNVVSNNLSTPMFVAIQHGQRLAVESLFTQGPYSVVSASGYTDLHCALHEGDQVIIYSILKRPEFIKPLINICSEEGGTPLMLACELDDAKLVQTLLDCGADSSAKRKDGVTPIEIAVRRGCIPVLQVLLKKTLPSPLAIEAAAQVGSVEIMRLLGTKCNLQTFENSCNDSCLHIALRHANIPVAMDLCSVKSLVNKTNLEKQTPFSLAVLIGAWDIVETLIANEAMPDLELLLRVPYHPLVKQIFDDQIFNSKKLHYYLLIAAEAGNFLAISQVLQPKKAKVEELEGPKGWRIRHYLAKADGIFLLRGLCCTDKDIVSPLAEEGNKTLPYIAAEHGSRRVLDFLLEQLKSRGISLKNHYQDVHLFYPVLTGGDLTLVKMVLDKFQDDSLENAILNEQAMRPVHIAAQIGSVEILQLLAQRGADFHCKDGLGRTALYYAIRVGDENTVAFLLNRQIPVSPLDLNAAASNSISDPLLDQLFTVGLSQNIYDEALCIAISQRNKTAAATLIKKGALPNHVNADGWTAELLAADTGQSDILELLFSHFPSNKHEIDGENALHLACRKGHTQCVAQLLEKGYVKDFPNSDNKTPLMLARNHRGVVELLKNKERRYFAFMNAFGRALTQGDAKEAKECRKNFLCEDVVSFDHNDKCLWGSSFLLLLKFCQGNDLESLIPDFFDQYKNATPQVLNAQDSAGNTLAHYLSRIGARLLNISDLNLLAVNHKGQTPLHLAAQEADIDLLQKMLKRLPPSALNMKDSKGRTPIFYAVLKGKIRNVEVLIQEGSDLRIFDQQLCTPLILACKNGILPSAKALLAGGVDPNQTGTRNRVMPLYVSIQEKHKEITRLILPYGARIDLLSKDGTHPIHYAAQTGDVELIRFFVAKGISIDLKDKKGLQPQHYAAQSGQIAVLEAISQMQGSLFDNPTEEKTSHVLEESLQLAGITPLHVAALSSSPDTTNWLLNHGANPEAKTQEGRNVLSFAAQNPAASSMLQTFDRFRLSDDPETVFSAISGAIASDNLDAVQMLYGKGLSSNTEIANENTGLHLACRHGSLQCTSWFLLNGADPMLEDRSGQNALELAAVNSSAEQFRLLLDFTDVDPDQAFQQGQTLMHHAVRAGKLNHVLILLMLGASVDLADYAGFTPLHIAVKEKQAELVRLLLACGADISKRSMQGQLPLELLANDDSTQEKNANDITQAFAERAQIPPTKDSRLHLAVKMGHPLATQLFAQSENVNELNEEGLAPLHVAAQNGSIEILLHLLRLGADRTLKDRLGRTPLWYAEKTTMFTKEEISQIFKSAEDTALKEKQWQ